MGKILLGCSGWHYKDWVGPLYTTDKESKLAAYSKVFQTVEIDSTYYAYPAKGVVMGWARYTKPEFVFTAKLPKKITHEDKLDVKVGADKDLEKFCELMQPLQLNGKLGCLLIQLPPNLKLDLKLLENFFAVLPGQFRFAVEFRDISWLKKATMSLLERYKVAYTIVDEPKLPPDVEITCDFAYIRWHGHGDHPWYYYLYDKEELEPWVPKVKEISTKAKVTYGYFNNHYHGYAVKNTIEFSEMLGTITPEQKEAKKTIDRFFQERETAKRDELKERAETLTAFMPKEAETMGFPQLLNVFMDRGRLKRAQGIKNSEVSLKEISDMKVSALVREYHVVFDMQHRTILHDCADWSRCIPVKQFCKHVGKVLLMLPRDRATDFLRQLALQREKWEFKPYVTLA